SAKAHAEPTELNKHVGTGRKPLDRLSPAGKHLPVPAAIRADSDRPAYVVENNSHSRECACEVGKLIDLRMKEPGVEGQAEASEDRDPVPEPRVGHEPGRRTVGRIAH